MSGSVDTVRPSKRFLVALACIAAAGLVLRIAYIQIASGAVGGDGRYYHAIAALLADGKGFIAPKNYLATGQVIASAPHPPAWPLLLAGFAFAGLRTTLEQQVIACLIGTGTIVLVAFAARRMAGGVAGVLAAAIAALYPNFWIYERELMSETLTLFGAALTILLAYRFRDRPTRGRAIALGFACGFIAITHAEQLLLVVALLIPLVLLARGVERPQKFAWAALAVAAAAVMIVPWAAYNTSRFHTPVLLGNELGITLTVSNCDFTYEGTNVGFQDLRCQTAATQAGLVKGEDEATRDDQYTHVGLDYVRAHLSRLPAVVAFREARTWGLYPRQLHFDTGRNTSYTILELGYAGYLMLVPAAIVGVVALRRRRVTMLPLYGFFLAVTLSTAITYGFTRFRAPAEVPIVLLAAVGIDAVRRRLSRWMATGERAAIPRPDAADEPEPAPLPA